jgi:hypothetical protein
MGGECAAAACRADPISRATESGGGGVVSKVNTLQYLDAFYGDKYQSAKTERHVVGSHM